MSKRSIEPVPRIGAEDSDLGSPLRGYRTPTLADDVFRRLAELIVQRKLEPGTRLNLDGIAEILRVSRQPIRDALLRLDRAGLIEIRPSRYTSIAELTEQRGREAREFAGRTLSRIAEAAVRQPHCVAEIVARVDAVAMAVGDSGALAVALSNMHIGAADTAFDLFSRSSSDVVYAAVRDSGVAMVGAPTVERFVAEMRRAINSADPTVAGDAVRALYEASGGEVEDVEPAVVREA